MDSHSSGQSNVCKFVFDDEAAAYLDEALSDPTFRAAYEDELLRQELLDAMVKLRKALKLTQGEVARRMNVRQPTVSAFENESSDPKFSTLQRYARAVGAVIQASVDMPAETDWVPEVIQAYDRSEYHGIAPPPVVRRDGSEVRSWLRSKSSYTRRDCDLSA